MEGSRVLPYGSGAPQVVDLLALAHSKASRPVRAILGANWADGFVSVTRPPTSLVAQAVGVSTTYVAAARKLAPEQRKQVQAGQRPLIIRPVPKPELPIPTLEERLHQIVAEIGLSAASVMLSTFATVQLPVAA